MVNEQDIYQALAAVSDPEVPVLSILDLGIVRQVSINENEVVITITPTYSGCPAMDVIATNIRMVLLSKGIKSIRIENQLSPAWTTDWMSFEGKKKLADYGIAPPTRKAKQSLGLFEEDMVPCPKCGSHNTEMTSAFGATACKSLYRCKGCLEPFEHFKCH
ncbi:MAG: phenylacetate-CoA oxygenase subunit PaaJ [Bacteroidetes bacterium]|nr:phenylacetate-CoA oxygenase subunit PaaJ [Bacteroidota bacterium]MBS1739665.1 phenylacetate-CoA oxygenase subunit PaaJ [Bacteroidota bacterium]